MLCNAISRIPLRAFAAARRIFFSLFISIYTVFFIHVCCALQLRISIAYGLIFVPLSFR